MDEYIRENLRYDPETGYLWWTNPSENSVRTPKSLNKPVGYTHSEGYLHFSFKLSSKKVWLFSHRVAWFLYYGSWPKDMLDHINGIRWDNRIENLREATNEQNARNQRSHKDSLSQHKGACWDKQNQKWKARIMVSGKQKSLGSYASEEEAARAYDKAAREQFGDYACLNFPEEHEQGATRGFDL